MLPFKDAIVKDLLAVGEVAHFTNYLPSYAHAQRSCPESLLRTCHPAILPLYSLDRLSGYAPSLGLHFLKVSPTANTRLPGFHAEDNDEGDVEQQRASVCKCPHATSSPSQLVGDHSETDYSRPRYWYPWRFACSPYSLEVLAKLDICKLLFRSGEEVWRRRSD